MGIKPLANDRYHIALVLIIQKIVVWNHDIRPVKGLSLCYGGNSVPGQRICFIRLPVNLTFIVKGETSCLFNSDFPNHSIDFREKNLFCRCHLNPFF